MNHIFKTILTKLIYIIFIGIALPFVLSFFNSIHPLFDSFSHFRVHLLLMLLPIMLILAFLHERKNRIIYFTLTLFGILYLYYINQPFKPHALSKEKTHTLKHIQFNLNFRNQKMDNFLSYLKESNADVITLEEVTLSHQAKLETLKGNSKQKGAYPYQAYCKFYPVVGAVAILSKHPFVNENSACLEGKGLQWSQILLNEQPINIVAIHTLWPFPYGQPQQIEEIKPVFKNIKGPTLIAGDFNAASWSYTIKQIEEASNTRVIEGMRWSIVLKKQLPLIPNFKLAIDHVLISDNFQVEKIFVEKDLGSDHLPIVSTMSY